MRPDKKFQKIWNISEHFLTILNAVILSDVRLYYLRCQK